ncbi:hypothetical protein B0H10DRAFT_1939389 [Mycena sp. CBHHK59/15]|nr:hypothetical protein B0H10DRAFT_1939389 [Mycena sp. CBHHK59/15]
MHPPVASPTFSPPPFDGSLLLPEIFIHHATHSPEHPLFRYLDTSGDVHTVSRSQGVRAFHAASHILDNHIPPTGLERPIVAILASIDQMTYLSVIAGILCAGYQAFPVSPRNSEDAVSHLLASSGCTHVFVSADAAMQKLAKAATTKISANGGDVKIIPIPGFGQLFNPTISVQTLPPVPKVDLDTTTIIMHSSDISIPVSLTSGTGHAEIDVCGEVLSSHAVPMFHLMGVIQLPWAAFTGMTITVFPPTVPPVVPTAARVFDGAVATGSTLMYSVPSFLELLVNTKKNRFLPEDLYNVLPHIDPVFVPLPDIPGVYHLVVKAYHMLSQKCPTHTPAILNTIVDGVPALNTNDLFVRHPVNPKLWKVFSRNDDQIMHSTGEKTNPGPLEAIILKDPGVKYALMFGRGKFHGGPTVEQANRFAPTHSRIFKEMILVANPLKPFELTAKGYPCRQVVLDMYQDEIRAFMPRLKFIRKVVAEVMIKIPGDDNDLFQYGCDSLQATWIRNSILQALRTSTKVDVRPIPHYFIYSYPTLRLLADFLTHLTSGSAPSIEDSSLQSILVTGTTGAFGCNIIAQLLALPNISMVYALNRPGSSIQDRQRNSFAENGIDIHLVESLKSKLLESDLNMPELGIPTDDYREIRENVTCIIHNAWQVNFNMSLSSMEPLVSGTRQLVQFALSSPHNFKEAIAPESSLPDPSVAVGLGYTESKWVMERMLEAASQETFYLSQ